MPTDLSESARNDRLNNRTTFVVQQMHLVDDQELDFLRNGPDVSRTRPRQGQIALTDAISPSPVGLRVTTSHFSGVVTMICVSAISLLVSCMSPRQQTHQHP